jgi:plasmid stability protein
MSANLQIRNVPPALHRRLKVRAAAEGVSMSELVLREIRKILERPPRAEVVARLRTLPVRRLRRKPADVIRAERDGR